MLRRPVRLIAAVLVLATLIAIALTLPGAARRTPTDGWGDTQNLTPKGALHIHTSRSDGTGSVDYVAAAAARAGLQFIVLSDHGDGTRNLESPSYRSGVLCIDGVEVSTTGGHYVAAGLRKTPYPLGGDPRDVIEDVRRLGGLGIAAHPDSAKPDLRWTDAPLPVDAFEWVNGDSEWRDESWPRLLLALTHYPIRPAGAVASVFDAPASTFQRWDRLAATTRVLAFPGADAHARLALTRDDREDEVRAENDRHRIVIPLPSYEAMFGTFSTRVMIDAALTGRAEDDAAVVLNGLKEGRAYSTIDALATPGWLEFVARQGDDTARMGATVYADRPIRWQARTAAPTGSTVVLLHNGVVIKETPGLELTHEGNAGPGSWRVEVRMPGAPGDPPIPFIVSNPIFVREQPAAAAPAAPAAPLEVMPLYADEDDTAGWRVEHQSDSRAAVDAVPSTPGRELAFRYTLNSNRAVLPYAAAVRTIAGQAAAYDRLIVRIRSDRVMRLSVQLRSSAAPDFPRWRRSVPIDLEMRDYELPFESFAPVPPETRPAPDLASIDGLLLVVDTVNTAPGTAGIVWLDDIRLARKPPSR